MTKFILPILMALTGGCVAGPGEVALTNESVTLRVYLPGATYRGPRFDWSGQIVGVTYRGRTIFGEWKPADSPNRTDDVVGPANEFSPVGDIKIGVGRLRIEGAYDFAKQYEILEAPPWRTSHGRDWVEFSQTFSNRYAYTKRIQLTGAGFTVAHTLHAHQPVSTEVYCHNFFVFDGQPVGPSNRVELACAQESRDLRGVAEIRGREVRFVKELPSKMGLWAPVNCTSNAFTMEHADLRVRVTGDRPTTKQVFYAVEKAICVEPFLQLDLPAGAVTNWTNTYEMDR